MYVDHPWFLRMLKFLDLNSSKGSKHLKLQSTCGANANSLWSYNWEYAMIGSKFVTKNVPPHLVVGNQQNSL